LKPSDQAYPASNVTVVIVNWNSADLLNRCLSALARQTLPPDKILVIDNGSNDGSTREAGQFPNVELREMGRNLGFAGGNNEALKACATEFVALLNPDALPEPDWLEKLIAAAHVFPEMAAFGSRQMAADSSEILDGTGDVYHLSGKVWRQGKGLPYRKRDDLPCEIFSPCACAALYRREALLSVDGFDDDYFCYVEDVDLGFRLRLAGYKALYVPDAVVHHIGSATTGGQHSDFSVYHGHRNLVWTFVKDMPVLLFWLLLPLHVLLNFVSVAYFVLRGRGRVILKAKRDALRGLPRVLQKRRRIQQARKATVQDIWRVLDKSGLPFR
jgi:GT2 family glycosyltransferase